MGVSKRTHNKMVFHFVSTALVLLPFSCMNACIYRRVDNGKMYCFAPGDLHVECEDEDVTGAPDGGTCKCGQKRTRKIIGGQEAEVGEYPWMTAIANRDGSVWKFCGSSLVAANWIVTAAHCLYDQSSGEINVFADSTSIVLAEHKWSDDSESALRKVVPVEEIFVHEDYSLTTQ